MGVCAAHAFSLQLFTLNPPDVHGCQRSTSDSLLSFTVLFSLQLESKYCICVVPGFRRAACFEFHVISHLSPRKQLASLHPSHPRSCACVTSVTIATLCLPVIAHRV